MAVTHTTLKNDPARGARRLACQMMDAAWCGAQALFPHPALPELPEQKFRQAPLKMCFSCAYFFIPRAYTARGCLAHLCDNFCDILVTAFGFFSQLPADDAHDDGLIFPH